MATKRTGAPVPSKSAPSLIPQTPQQSKSRSPPPSPPCTITLKDLQDAMAQMAKQNVEYMAKQNAELVNLMVEKNTELMNKKHEELRQDILLALEGIASHVERMDECIEQMGEHAERVDERLNKIEENADLTQNELILIQYREMEFALRIRGVKENQNENLRGDIAVDLAVALNCKTEEIEREIEKAYRVNSWVARQRKLPRDIVIYFSRRTRRNEIIQKFYNEKFQIAAQNVIILKEIPPKILRKRKEFAFLTEELKKRQIQFRWEIPIGIVVTVAGTRYRLNSVSKAKDFYSTVLKADSPLSSRADSREEMMVQQVIEEDMLLRAQYLLDREKDPKSQRLTRAAHKRKEKELQRELQKEEQAEAVASQLTVLEPVGGARPKRAISADMAKALDRFKGTKDGEVPDLEH